VLLLVLIHIRSIRYKYVLLALTRSALLFFPADGVALLIPNRMEDFYLSE
jgi:hypothetical protein